MRPVLVLALLSTLGCGGDDAASSSGGAASSSGSSGSASSSGGASSSSSGGPTDGGSSGADASARPTALYALTGGGDGVIRVFAVDAATGEWTARGSLAAGTSPSFLAADTVRGRVYAVDESGGGSVLSFAFDPKSGALTSLGAAVPSQGAGPTHLSIDPTGKWVLVAMYTAGKVGVFPIGPSGLLGAATDVASPGDKAHLAITSPSGGYAFVPCLGANIIAQYTFNGATGKLTPNAAGSASPPPGAGPRHLDFHPGEAFAYGVNELASTLTTYGYDKAKGALTPIETKTTLPAGFSGANTGAEVFVHPSGKWVFTSNRGHDSIATFAIDAGTGKATLASHASTGGKTPRSFAVDPKGAFVFAANQASDTVQALRVDPSTGALTPIGAPRPVPKPTFVGLFAFALP